MAGSKVSIYDIAELAGISAGSVSKILNNKGNFSQKTRERVLAIAQEQGYVANFAAKSLRDAHTRTVGIVTPDISNDFFSSIIQGVEVLLREAGYTSYICSFSNDPDVERDCVRSFLQKQVDGFAFIGGRWAIDLAGLGVNVPSVCIDHDATDGSDCVVVNSDMAGMAYDATSVLARRGCERVAALNVSSLTTSTPGLQLLDGYHRALVDAGMEVIPELYLTSKHRVRSYMEAEELVSECLEAGLAPDGIVAVGDRVALGAINALVKRGLVPGKDVKVIGMDNSVYSRIVTPAVSSIDRNVAGMAREASQALLAMLGGKKPERSRIIIPHRVIERATTLGE